MTQKEISAKLGWFIRNRYGFYCNGKECIGLQYGKDVFYIHGEGREVVELPYDVEIITTFHNGKPRKKSLQRRDER